MSHPHSKSFDDSFYGEVIIPNPDPEISTTSRRKKPKNRRKWFRSRQTAPPLESDSIATPDSIPEPDSPVATESPKLGVWFLAMPFTRDDFTSSLDLLKLSVCDLLGQIESTSKVTFLVADSPRSRSYANPLAILMATRAVPVEWLNLVMKQPYSWEEISAGLSNVTGDTIVVLTYQKVINSILAKIGVSTLLVPCGALHVEIEITP